MRHNRHRRVAVAVAAAVICWLSFACDPGRIRDSSVGDAGTLDGASRRDAPSLDATSDDRPTGDNRGGDATGTDTWSSDARGADIPRQESGSADSVDPRQCGSGEELCTDWGTDCGLVEGYDRCWEAASAFCGTCATRQVCSADNVCVPEICSDTGWCWQRPTPQANDLYGVTAAGSDFWLVGEGGMVLRWDGSVFHRVHCDTTAALEDVWAAGTDDVWVVGQEGVVRHVTGDSCEAVDVGLDGSLVAVSGSGSEDIWIGAEDGTLAHRDASGWTTSSLGAEDLIDLWVVVGGDAWAVSRGEVRRNTGGGWQLLDTGGLNSGLWTGWGSSASEVWIVGDSSEGSSLIVRWDGRAFSREETESTVPLNTISGNGPDDLWAGGQFGTILRRSGGEWTMPWPERPWWVILAGVGCAPSSVMFGGLYGVILHWDGAQLVERQQGVGADITGFWGTSDTDVWAMAHAAGIFHWDGTHWGQKAYLDGENIESVWGTGDALWGVGDAIYGWTGDSWQAELEDTNLRAIWGSGPSDIWAGGSVTDSNPSLLRYDGVSWEPVEPGAEGIHYVSSIWGSSATDVWFFGQQIVHYNGAEWVPYRVAGTPSVAWGSGPDNVWIVNGFRKVERFNGVGFEEMMSDRNDDWRAIWGRGPDDVWALSIAGVAAHWNGSTWSFEDTGVTSQLTALWGTATGEMWAGGGVGTIVHRRP